MVNNGGGKSGGKGGGRGDDKGGGRAPVMAARAVGTAELCGGM